VTLCWSCQLMAAARLSVPLVAIVTCSKCVLYPLQIPAFFAGPLQPLASLIGGIVCLLALAGYCAHQAHPLSLLHM